MYVSINKEFLDKNSEKAEKESMNESGDIDGKGRLLWVEIPATVKVEEVNGTTLNITMDSELGYFTADVELDVDAMATILESLVKKVNRIKTILEATE